MIKIERIYKKPNLNKIAVNSLFASGGTFENLSDFTKIDIITKYDKENNKMYFNSLYARVLNDKIQFVYNNNVICKKIVHSFEFSYKIQKTQIKSSGIERILNSDTWNTIFAENIVNKYFNLK